MHNIDPPPSSLSAFCIMILFLCHVQLYQSNKCSNCFPAIIPSHSTNKYYAINKQLISNHQTVSYEKGVLKNLAKLTGKHLRHSHFLNKVAVLKSTTLLKRRLRHRCFSVNVAKSLRTPFLQNTSSNFFCSLTMESLLSLIHVFYYKK